MGLFVSDRLAVVSSVLVCNFGQKKNVHIMKISIITTCFNRTDTICDAIESVLAQDYDDMEYVIVDGASTDGSVERIRRAIEGHEDRVRFVSEPDHGMYEAINKGIRMASGEVIGLCHSDDFIYAGDTVSRVAARMEATGCDFLYADGLFVDGADLHRVVRKWIGGRYARWKVRCGWLPLHPTCYIKRDVMMRCGLYDETYRIAADTKLLVNYLYNCSLKVEYLPEYVTRMRMGGMSTDPRRRRQMWHEDIRVYESYGFSPVVLTKLMKMAWKVPQFILAKFMGQ